MNILITTSSFNTVKEFPEGFNVIFNPFGRKLTEVEISDLIEQYKPIGMIAGVEPLTRDVLEKAKDLKVISRCGVGTDSVDLAAAEELGIKVAITAEAPVASVAELTLGMILAFLRRIPVVDAGIRQGGWKGPKGNLLSGKVVGVVGCGRIGTYVSNLVSHFGCRVLGYDPHIKEHEICCMKDLEDVLQLSDIVTLHIPYTQENRHLIGEKELGMMKNTAILVNNARGGLVDELALYDALKNGVIAGAALDCFEEEPYSGPLTGLENTLLTPHMGSSAIESRATMEKHALENLIKGLKEE